LKAAGKFIGIFNVTVDQWFGRDVVVYPQAATIKAVGHTPSVEIGISADLIAQKIAERLAARRNKDFARADAIRAELAAAGILLEDGPGGTTWRRA
jgi:cysteinyl-tRNA synthetase